MILYILEVDHIVKFGITSKFEDRMSYYRARHDRVVIVKKYHLDNARDIETKTKNHLRPLATFTSSGEYTKAPAEEVMKIVESFIDGHDYYKPQKRERKIAPGHQNPKTTLRLYDYEGYNFLTVN